MEETMVSLKDPARVAYVSFTNAATDDAKARAMERLGLEDEKSIPYFSTIHALAFREMKLRREQVFTGQHVTEFGNWIGAPISGSKARDFLDEGIVTGVGHGDRMLFLYGLARATRQKLETVWEQRNAEFDVEWWEMDRFARGLDAFKQHRGLLDFPDMLDRYLERGEPIPVDVAIIDEGQDLSRHQWEVIDKAFANASEVVIAGDDDQCIHAWNGADINHFMNLKATVAVLKKSHRMPRNIFDFAAKIANRMSTRYEKVWEPRDGDPGRVERILSYENLDLSLPGTWYILARNHFIVKEVETWLKDQGIIFSSRFGNSVDPAEREAIETWQRLQAGGSASLPEATSVLRMTGSRKTVTETRPYAGLELFSEAMLKCEWDTALHRIHPLQRGYYRRVMRANGRLDGKPRIYTGTIHSVKGGEADNVCILPDMARNTWLGDEGDNEHRVAYVAASRAKQTLWICEPQGKWWYEY
jgi:superfamily I DNA/RNA helicase